MPLTPQEVASKVFGPTRMRRGYDENEVDAFLDVVEAELTRLTTENARLRRELEGAGHSAAGIEEIATTPGAADPPPVVAESIVPAAATTIITKPVIAADAAAAPAVEATPDLTQVEQPAAVTKEVAPAPVEEAPVEQRVTRMLVLAQQTADAAIQEAQTDADRLRGSARIEAERLVADARVRAAEEIGALERSKASLESQVEQLQAFEREYRDRLRAYLTIQLTELDHQPAGPPAVEGQAPNVLDVSDAGADSGDRYEPPTSDEQPTAGLSDPPGFGAVWSPENGGSGDPMIGSSRPAEGQSAGSPFDTGTQGQRSGGYGAA